MADFAKQFKDGAALSSALPAQGGRWLPLPARQKGLHTHREVQCTHI
jgi:hypothetical protein